MKKVTAVIIVDMQNFFLRNFSASISNRLIENQRQVIQSCLKIKMPFIYLEYKAGGVLRGKTVSDIDNLVGKHFKEIIIKENNSGFTDTNLDVLLKSLNVGTILLMGLNANGCVQDTAIGAIHRGYKVMTSEGIIASSSRKDLSLSERNKSWFKENTIFFRDTESLVNYLKSA